MTVLIPILDDNLQIIGTTEFIDNLTLKDVPDYVNMNAKLGLKRLDTKEKICDGLIVFMMFDIMHPNRSYAEIVSELEAYKMCLSRNKLELASELGLKFMLEREVQ
jgi:hypothetical protein